MKTTLLLVSSCIIICSFSAKPKIPQRTHSNNFTDSLTIEKTICLKRNVVKLYPNPSYGRITVSANSSEQLHFMIFDLEGTLIYQTTLSNKEKKLIDNLKKGFYTYDVFENDESIEEGKIIIK